MQLSLFSATLFSGLALLGLGLAFGFSARFAATIKGFPRSKVAAYVTMGLAGAWTLYRVSQLGEADYGDYKQYILIGFLILGVGAFKYAPDFLSVRGACILFLLVADLLLGAAFGLYETPLRLFLVTPVYLGIALSLYLAYAPYRVRDFLSWLFVAGGRLKLFGLVVALYGGLLSGVAFAY